MRLMILKAGAIFLALMLVMPMLAAKEATPMADDPEMEKRVNEIASELRCLVCQNQTIADSHAELAVDLKNQVREMVKTGQTQTEIVDYMVQRYGDFVRYRPPIKATTLLLWTGPFLLLAIGLVVLIVNLRKRRTLVADDAPLSAEEAEKLNALLSEEQQEQKDTGEGDSKS